jgi:hypothetical protein
MDSAELKRFTYRQLNTQAKKAFRQIQMDRPEGGFKQDYRYKGWDILINNGIMLQVVHYDVFTPEVTLKRSTVVTL